MKRASVRVSSVPPRGLGSWRSAIGAAAAVLLFAPPAPAAVTLSVTPTNIVWNSNLWVNLDVTGLTAGQTVDLSLHTDINRNGAVDAMDTSIMRFRVQDGVTNSLGSQVIVCDTNGVTDGQIHARVSYHGAAEEAIIWHAAGPYLWRVLATNGAVLTSAAFTVSQPGGTAWITGAVQVITSIAPLASYPRPGALVGCGYYSEIQGVTPGVWADTNGNFRLDLPAGVSTDNIAGVSAYSFGHFMAETVQDKSMALSTVILPDVLHPGANALPQPLYVVPPLSGEVYTVSGHVYDENTNALAGVMVQCESDSENDDGDAFGLAMTDTNGVFTAPISDMGGEDIIVYAMGPVLNMRGFVAGGVMLGVVTSDVSGVAIYLPRATTLVKGLVRKTEGPDGIPGIGVSLYGDSDIVGGAGITFDGAGRFEIGMVGATNVFAEVSRTALKPLLRFSPWEVASGLTIPSSGIWTGLTIRADRGWVVSGHVYDERTNALPGGSVGAWAPQAWDSADEIGPNLNGYYELLLTNNDYQVGTWGYADLGYIDQTRTSLVTVTSANVGGIDFYLPRGAEISGRVLAGGSPLPDAPVEAGLVTTNEWDGWDWSHVAGTQADPDGYYSLTVPPGSGYVVRAWGPDGTLWLEQFYSNATDGAQARRIAVWTNAPATNINFNLQQGAEISGRVLGGGSPLADAPVDAGFVTTNEWGGWDWSSVAGTGTDPDGYYSLAVPPGSDYVVRAWGPDGTLWLEQFYSNATDAVQARRVAAWTNAPATNIDFNLQRGAEISGQVLAGGNPLPDAQVEAGRATTNEWGDWDWFHVAGTQTDPEGYYSLAVPPGSDYVVRAWGPEGSPWLEQYYSNAMDIAQARRIAARTNAPATSIDFDLLAGALISGRVTAPEGAPLADIPMAVLWYGGGDWNWVANGGTDSQGDFRLYVPPGSNYMVWVVGTDQWLDQCYQGVRGWDQAQLVTTRLVQAATNLDFVLTPAMTIRGSIVNASNEPVSGQFVDIGARDGGGTWVGRWGANSDGAGRYSSRMEALSNHLVRITGGEIQEVYYNGKLSAAAADVLSAAQGVIVSNVNFRLFSPTADTDGDSYLDYIEGYVTGTDPLNGNDFLRCTGARYSNGVARITWAAASNRSYVVQRTTVLNPGDLWTNLPGSPVTASDTNGLLVDSNASWRALYRVLVPDGPMPLREQEGGAP